VPSGGSLGETPDEAGAAIVGVIVLLTQIDTQDVKTVNEIEKLQGAPGAAVR